jgi:hypothetical protein
MMDSQCERVLALLKGGPLTSLEAARLNPPIIHLPGSEGARRENRMHDGLLSIFGRQAEEIRPLHAQGVATERKSSAVHCNGKATLGHGSAWNGVEVLRIATQRQSREEECNGHASDGKGEATQRRAKRCKGYAKLSDEN